MPRLARLDFPGALQHVMARGIERRAIFLDEEDRERFLARLDRILSETGTRCFAFAVMGNHYHLLTETGATPLSRVMARLGTAHGMGFNRRHRRVGHLFQNRYKSKIVRGETGLITLVRYIHLNPVKAGMVPDLGALADYPWTGHAALLGRRRAPFLDARAVLECFGRDLRTARRELLWWMRNGAEGIEYEEAPDEAPPESPVVPPDPDPLGDLALLAKVHRRRLREAGWDLARVRAAVCAGLGLDEARLHRGARNRILTRGREAIAALAVETLGFTHAAVARAAGVSRQAIEQALARYAAWPESRRADIQRLLPAFDRLDAPLP